MADLSNLDGSGTHPNSRAKDAASIILFDRSQAELKVLIGKRSSRHVFMPNLFVFPGGRRDASDHRLSYSTDLTEQTHAALSKTLKVTKTQATARALALAAMRELQEETGIVCWKDRTNSKTAPNLSALRFVARAITPPRNIRRYDTRFFSAFIDELGLCGPDLRDSDELHDIQWLSVGHKSSVNMPAITQLVLDDAIAAMTDSRQWDMQAPVVEYVVRHKRFHRNVL